MNITSSVGYIICYVRWAEGYIPWHVELFRCHVHGYILLRNLQIQCVPPLPFPTMSLRADSQQIESKACLFTPRQAHQAPQHTRSVLLISCNALIIVGYG